MINGDKKDSDVLRHYCQLLANNIDATGQVFTHGNLTQRTYLDLIRRIRCSLLGIIVQLERWPQIIELKLPISLAFRTALTDALTGLYLATFNEHPTAFQHELMVLDLDFYRYIKAIIENTELEMPKATEAEVEQEKQARWANLHQAAAHLLQDGNTNLKTPQSFREPSDHQLFQVPGNIGKRLGEKEMFDQIKAHPDTAHLAYFYLVQRHLSQQHHYAPANSSFIQMDPAYDCSNWFKSLVSLNEISGALAGLLGTQGATLQSFRDAQSSLLEWLADRG